jgi:radical SAM superfamily enzyme YgiQ (UPF0313 family)
LLSWVTVQERMRERRRRERFLFPKKSEAPVRVCLLYANRYAPAMGNLGFQVVYELIDRHPEVVCERAFLPEPEERVAVAGAGLRTLESGRRVSDFDILAFSISFEADYLNVIPMLELAGVEPWRRQRTLLRPLVLAGGPAVFLNPEPIADFVDLFLLGEAEEMLPEFLDLYCAARASSQDPHRFLDETATQVRGAYVPALYEPAFDGPVQTALHYTGRGDGRVERRLVWDLNPLRTATRVLAEDAVFGDMMLVEVSRGCQWGCRFCAAGFMYRPVRTREDHVLRGSLRQGLNERGIVGIVGAEIASVPGVETLAELASRAGGRLSPSSLKADCVSPRLAAALAGGGNRSVTVAPEAGSERLRRVINKNLRESEILRAADLLVGEGVPSLKLYFMFGLPTETDDDVRAIPQLVEKIHARLCDQSRKRGRVGGLTVSLNPFSPRPWTPFQWDPMETVDGLRAKTRLLRKESVRIPNLQLDVESPREAYLSTLLCRGDRRVSRFLARTHESGGNWWHVIREWQRHVFDDLPHPDAYVYRVYDDAELLPWDFINHRIDKRYLRAERRKAFEARETPPCDTSTCTSCAACLPGARR